MRRIGILLFDDVEELDAVGPYEVFGSWAQHHPHEVEVVTFATRSGLVRGAKGLRMFADHGMADVGDLDVLVYPGGIGTRVLMKDLGHLDWVRAQRYRVPLLASVCTGALVLAAAGLLVDRAATTHWSAMDLLVETEPRVRVRPDHRFVDAGDLVTSAGVSAGIDMALYLVSRLAGPERAAHVRRYIQYDPRPPV